MARATRSAMLSKTCIGGMTELIYAFFLINATLIAGILRWLAKRDCSEQCPIKGSARSTGTRSSQSSRLPE